jgi:hypothetical protein
MITDGCSDADRKMLIKRVGEHPLPSAQARRLWLPGLSVTAPDTGNSHIDLSGHLNPGQALVTQLQDLLRGGWVSWSTARTPGDAGSLELLLIRLK